MPNINLRDGRNRDAIVRAERAIQYSKVTYVDKEGAPAKTRKVLKATSDMSFERLSAAAGGGGRFADTLVAGDSDFDVERLGMFLTHSARVFVNDKDEIAYQIEQTEIVRSPAGDIKDRRPRRRAEPNVESEFPITWTGRLLKKDEALRRFVFSSKLQIVHVNGLTYDFLYGMAKELAEAGSLMLLGAGKSGKDPLIFQRGATPHRGFLEGRIDGDRYMLILHLSKLELKRPAEIAVAAPAVVAATAAPAVAEQPNAPPAPSPAEMPAKLPVEAPAAAPEPLPIAAAPGALEPAAPAKRAPRKPTAKEVIAATGGDTAPAVSRADISETVTAAKGAKNKRTGAAVSAKSAPADPAAAQSPEPAARKTRAKAGSQRSPE